MAEKNTLGRSGLSLQDLEGSHNEILARIARELASEETTVTGHSSHSSSSGGGHYSYNSATGPSKAQDETTPEA